jgi:hypothetical protein
MTKIKEINKEIKVKVTEKKKSKTYKKVEKVLTIIFYAMFIISLADAIKLILDAKAYIQFFFLSVLACLILIEFYEYIKEAI